MCRLLIDKYQYSHTDIHIIFITTENIAVDEIGRMKCSYLLARAHIYFYIKLLCMHDAVTCNIIANYSAVHYK